MSLHNCRGPLFCLSPSFSLPPLHLLPHVNVSVAEALREKRLLISQHRVLFIHMEGCYMGSFAKFSRALFTLAHMRIKVIPCSNDYDCITSGSVFYRHTGERKIDYFSWCYFSSPPSPSLSLVDPCISEVIINLTDSIITFPLSALIFSPPRRLSPLLPLFPLPPFPHLSIPSRLSLSSALCSNILLTYVIDLV